VAAGAAQTGDVMRRAGIGSGRRKLSVSKKAGIEAIENNENGEGIGEISSVACGSASRVGNQPAIAAGSWRDASAWRTQARWAWQRRETRRRHGGAQNESAKNGGSIIICVENWLMWRRRIRK